MLPDFLSFPFPELVEFPLVPVPVPFLLPVELPLVVFPFLFPCEVPEFEGVFLCPELLEIVEFEAVMVFCTGFVLAEFPVDCEITGCVEVLGMDATGGIIGRDVGFGCSFGGVF